MSSSTIVVVSTPHVAHQIASTLRPYSAHAGLQQMLAIRVIYVGLKSARTHRNLGQSACAERTRLTNLVPGPT